MVTKQVHKLALLLAGSGLFALAGGAALALTEQQIAAINSGVLDAVANCTFDAQAVPNQIEALAVANLTDPSDIAAVAGTVITAAQTVTESPSCLFAVGEGLTRWALSFGETSAAAITVGTTIGQLGQVPVVNACVNVAGVDTDLGLACDPPTSDVMDGGRTRTTGFGSSSENPNQDDPSPN